MSPFQCSETRLVLEYACMRDDQDRFVLAKTEWIAPCIDVELGEALGLLSALQWVNNLHLHNMNFEMDSKRAVDCLYSDTVNVSEL
ncbi:cytochrome p450, partial [Trifolium pratense]